MAYLFLVNVGPVQQFIAAGRRSRDLWYGSWWLSELSRTVALTIAERCGAESLISPAPDNKPALKKKFRIINRILAHIPIEPEEMEREAEAALRGRLEAMREEAFTMRSDASRALGVNLNLAIKQVDDLPEFYWVALPLAPGGDYALARRRLEHLMAARKATRLFKAVDWGSAAPKSSLDGQRESVIPPMYYPQPGATAAERREQAVEMYRKFAAGPAEYLSGVDLLKRLGTPTEVLHPGREETYFPSTSHMAALPLLAGLVAGAAGTDQAAHPAWGAYIENLRADGVAPDDRVARPYRHRRPGSMIDGYDGSALFEARLLDDLPPDQRDTAERELFGNLPEERRGRELARRMAGYLRTFLQGAAGVECPIPYYAILLADGDGMGKAFDAHASVAAADGTTGWAAHRRLSAGVDAFAEEVRGIVEGERHVGALVFAGGDDVLAFLPLHTVLECARTLHEAFDKKMQEYAHPDAGGGRPLPTLSMGIVICHHLEPLSDALDLVRGAEKAAKRVKDKDALAITLSKRGGADLTVRGHWGALDERLARFVKLYRLELIPSGAGHELDEMQRRLTAPTGTASYDALQQAYHVEAKRILGRKEPGRGQNKMGDHILKELEGLIDAQLQERLASSKDAAADLAQELASSEDAAADLAQELIVARLLADAADMARLPVAANSDAATPPSGLRPGETAATADRAAEAGQEESTTEQIEGER